MSRVPRRFKALVIGCLVASSALSASPVSAAAPEQFGPNYYDYTFIGFSCDGFDIQISGAGIDRATVFFEGSGREVFARAVIYARFPHDVLTNTVTGRSIVVRGEFQEIIEPIPGTDDFTKAIVGFRYMVNEPRTGATIREVGRISYADAQQTIILAQAGKHDLALDEELLPAFCAALA